MRDLRVKLHEQQKAYLLIDLLSKSLICNQSIGREDGKSNVKTKYLISPPRNFDSHRGFGHHHELSSLLARWRGEQTVSHVTQYVAPSSLFIADAIFLIEIVSLIQRAHQCVRLSTTFVPSQSISYLCFFARYVMAGLLGNEKSCFNMIFIQLDENVHE